MNRVFLPLFALSLFVVVGVATRDVPKVSFGVTPRELDASEKAKLMAGKMRPLTDPALVSLLETDNSIEERALALHRSEHHNMRCVGEVASVCRKHRDWCRQECDLHDSHSDDRCHSAKCDELLDTCHRAHFDSCNEGSEKGVHESWRNVMDSRTFCVKKIELKCDELQSECLSSCKESSSNCSPTQCSSMLDSCHRRHQDSCSSPKLGRATSAAASHSSHASHDHSSESAHASPSSHGSHSESAHKSEASGLHTKDIPLPGALAPNSPKKSESSLPPYWQDKASDKVLHPFESTKPSHPSKHSLPEHTSMSHISTNGYFRCEQNLAKKCTAELKACVGECRAQSMDGESSKCNPEKCYDIHSTCSESDKQCDTNKHDLVTAEELKPDQHLCKPEDTGCNTFTPTVVDKIECNAENHYCANEHKSPVSSCNECEQKRFVCIDECKAQQKIITFSSKPGPQPKPCNPEKCFQDAEICHTNTCKPEKAEPKVEAREIPFNSTRKALLEEEKRRAEIKEATDKKELKALSAAGVCGNRLLDGAEECDGGEGCLDECKCKPGFKPQEPRQQGCVGGPAPCAFARSGCMFGKEQVVPDIVPRGSLFSVSL